MIYIPVLILFVFLFIFNLFSEPEVNISTPYSKRIIPTPVPERVEGQIVVKFKSGVTEEQINQKLALYNATIIDRIPEINRVVFKVPDEQTDAILEMLLTDELIEIAEPNYVRHQQASPNDPFYTRQWFLKNTGQAILGKTGTAGSDIKIEQAWTVTRGNGIKVALVDGGIDFNHPDLAGKVAASKVFRTGLTNASDQNGHGTHTAGIVAANTNNSTGVAGVCPECRLLIARALDKDGNGGDVDISKGILWAADQGAAVINISIGGPTVSTAERDAISQVIQRGVIVVASAGNCSRCTNYPAQFPGVVSVTSTDNNDQVNPASNTGSWIKIAAPGLNIYSTCPTGTFELEKQGFPKNYCFNSGTSMAAPLVAGVLALIRSTPYGSNANAAIQRLYSTADRITGTGTLWQNGRVNAAKAVGASTVTPTAPVAVPSAQCLGAACPTLVPTDEPMNQPTNAPIMTNTPIATNPPLATTAPTDEPTEEPVAEEPTTAPGGGQTPGTNRPPGTPNGGLLGLLLNAILAFIRLLLALLGR